MSTLKVDSITNNGNPVNFTTDIAVGNGTVKREYYSQADAPSTTTNGAVWWDTTNSVYKMLIEGEWYTVGLIIPPPSITGDRAIFAGGFDNSADFYFGADYFSISTPGNASVFGNLSIARQALAGVSNGTLGVFGGGDDVSFNTYNVIEYFTFSTLGNATDFGDFTVHGISSPHSAAMGTASDGTYGLFAGGGLTANTTSGNNVIEYIVFDTPGNATDFGDLTVARNMLSGVSDTTYGIFAGGGNYTNVIDYVTIATAGNATDFGDLTEVLAYGPASCFSATRGVFAGGRTNTPSTARVNTIAYITMATPGNATDFGDLLALTDSLAGTSDLTTGVFAGGETTSSGRTVTIAYITIDTPGNATDFGDLTDDPRHVAACSGN